MNATPGFAPSTIKNLGVFVLAWSGAGKIRKLATADFHCLPSGELSPDNRQMPSDEIRQLPTDELDQDNLAAFCSVGFSPHREIIRFCWDLDEWVHYIQSCTKKGGRR